MKTYKQIADELGISKDKVKYRARKLPKKYLVITRGITHVTDEGVAELRVLLGVKTEENIGELPGEVTREVVALLRDELAAKNKQIENLTDALRVAQQTAAAAQALHAATVQQNLETDAGKPRQRGFFAKIFGKKGDSADA